MKMTIIKHDDIASKNFRSNSDWCNDHGITSICCVCGKAINDNDSKMLHWFDGGDLLTDFGEFPEDLKKRDHRFEESGDLLCYPVGPDCYRKWLKMKATGKYEVDV